MSVWEEPPTNEEIASTVAEMITDSEMVDYIIDLVRQEQADPAGTAASLKIGCYSLFLTICALQLAWRHPAVSPGMRAAWRQTGELMAAAYGPELQQIIALGWDPTQDFTPGT